MTSAAELKTPRTDALMIEVQAMNASIDWNDVDSAANIQHRTFCMAETLARQLERELGELHEQRVADFKRWDTECDEHQQTINAATEWKRKAETAERELAEARNTLDEKESAIDELCAELSALRSASVEGLRHFVNNNMTFYDVDRHFPFDGPNMPVLGQVSKRIWYHATDDTESYPFSAVIDKATGKERT